MREMTAESRAYWARWRPASGYRAASGRFYWRVMRGLPTEIEQHADSRGLPRLYRTMEAAQRAADRLERT